MSHVEIFISYSHKDEKPRQELIKHINILKRQGLINDWHDRKILPGSSWEHEINEHLNIAKIILLLVSADFLSSDYCYNIEMQRALERHAASEARVIPIIIRDVDWKDAPFGKLQALPTDGIPVSSAQWKNRDEAFTNIAKGLRTLIQSVRNREGTITPTSAEVSTKRRSVKKPAVVKNVSAKDSQIPERISNPQKRFVDEVGELYQLLGFKVYQDTSISRKPSVLICEQVIRGGPAIRLYVECKEQRKQKVLPSFVRQFVADYRSIPEEKAVTGAVLVAQYTPSQDARDAVNNNRCRVLSYLELFDELLNVSSMLRAYASWYERQEIYLSYLPLRCSKRPQHAPRKNVQEADVIREIYTWLSDPEKLFVVLGDFGTGKTTILQRLKYEFASKYRTGVTDLVPVYIPLRNYESIGSLEKFIELQLQNELGVRVPFNRFVEFLGQSKLLLLLDGFDEMGQQVDQQKRRSNFEELLPLLLASPKSILTCRPAYFLTDHELDSVIGSLSKYTMPIGTTKLSASTLRKHDNFLWAVEKWNFLDSNFPKSLNGIRSVQLCELSARDIDQYVKSFMRRVGEEDEASISSLRERIRKTYDLEDLAKRPVLLNIIVQTVPLLPTDIEASPSVIYSAYSNSWMNHEYAKGQVRMLVPASEKRRFMQTLAWQMYVEGVVELHYSKIMPHLSKFFRVQNRMADFVATDIQACSFLERDQDGTFQFSHKSFLEYFAAEYLRDKIKQSKFDCLNKSILADAVCFFLGDMVHADDALRHHFEKNLVLMLNGAGMGLPKLVIENFLRVFRKARIGISGIKAWNTRWSGMKFCGNSFSGKFSEPTWDNLTFEKCSMTNLTLESLRGSDLVIQDSKFHYVVISDTKDSKLAPPDRRVMQIRNSQLDNVKFHGAVSAIVLDSSINYSELRADRGQMHIVNSSIGHGDIEHCFNGLSLTQVKLNRCNLSGSPPFANNTNEFISVINQRWKLVKDTKSKKQAKPLGDVETNKDVKFMEWEDVELKECLLMWWDFSQLDLTRYKFKNCWFVACRFRDAHQMEAFLKSGSTRCGYSFLCLQNLGGNKELRSDRILLESLTSLTPQAAHNITGSWLRAVDFLKDPTQAVRKDSTGLPSLAGLLAPHTVDDLL